MVSCIPLSFSCPRLLSIMWLRYIKAAGEIRVYFWGKHLFEVEAFDPTAALRLGYVNLASAFGL